MIGTFQLFCFLFLTSHSLCVLSFFISYNKLTASNGILSMDMHIITFSSAPLYPSFSRKFNYHLGKILLRNKSYLNFLSVSLGGLSLHVKI